MLVVASPGLGTRALETLVADKWKAETGDRWSCPEGAQLERGKTLGCDLVRAGKRRRMHLIQDEAATTFIFNPVGKG